MSEDSPAFSIDAARRILDDVFAPWIKELALSVESIVLREGQEPGAVLRLPFSERLCRDNGVVAANRGYRPMTTVDQTTHFMRAVASSDVLADARVVRLGRTMSFGRVTLTSAADAKPVAMVSSAFAML